jgi:hypothetical protein
MSSFAIQAPNLRHFGALIEVVIMQSASDAATIQASGNPLPQSVRVTALIDTGASKSVIRQGTGAQLGLEPIGTRFAVTPTAANIPCPEYVMRMRLSEDFAFDIALIEMPLHGHYIDCLIGRDVLARGVFIYLGSGNAFTLSI